MKGGILVAIHAVEALIQSKALHVNVKFLLEGQVWNKGRFGRGEGVEEG